MPDTKQGIIVKQSLRWVLYLTGLAHVMIGLGLLLAPGWFFSNIGPFAPFNRHYEGDLGAFTLPLGLGLMLAGQKPERNGVVVGVAAAANLLHTLNHTYDALLIRADLNYWLQDVGPLLLFTVLLLWTLYTILREP